MPGPHTLAEERAGAYDVLIQAEELPGVERVLTSG